MSVVSICPGHLVEVRFKPEYADITGQTTLAQLQHAGFPAARMVRVSALYRITGGLSQAQVQQAAKELLADGVTQEFKLINHAPVLNGMNHWRIEVWLKPTVTDAVGESVRQAMVELGLPLPASVRCGTAYRILGRSSRQTLERVVFRSLANPVIHTLNISEAYD